MAFPSQNGRNKSADSSQRGRRSLSGVFKGVAGGIAAGMLFNGVLAGAVTAYQQNEMSKPVSTEPGQASIEAFTKTVLALPDPGERTANARLGYASGRYDKVSMLFAVYRDAPDVMADYHESLASRVKKECRNDIVSQCPAPLKNSIASAFEFYTASEPYAAWQRQRVDAFERGLEQEPAFAKVAAHWNELSKVQKLQALQSIADFQAQVFSDDTLHLSAPQVKEAVLAPTVGGTYDRSTNTIRLPSSVLEHYSFENVMLIIGHEGGHRVHKGLGDLAKTASGRDYLSRQGILDDVRMLYLSSTTLNMDALTSTGDVGPSHYLLPDERDAEKIGYSVSLAAENALPEARPTQVRTQKPVGPRSPG